VPLPCGDALLVCVSLTGAHDGFHYKVMATVFEGVPVSESRAGARGC
jgi:hypothetical protein